MIIMSKKLDGKVAVITGAGSGISQATAKLFAAEGAKLILAGFTKEKEEKTAADIRNTGANAISVAVDMSNEDQVEKMIQTAVDHFGHLDILVNNAGMMDKMSPIANLDDDTWNKVIAVNLTGVASRAAVKVMKEQGHGGAIVNVASIAALRGGMAGAAYCASKASLLGLSRSISVGYMDDHIRSNVIAPGGVATNIGTTMHDIDPEGVKNLKKTVTIKSKPATSDQIARPILFLASDDSDYISGQVLTADLGGIMVG